MPLSVSQWHCSASFSISPRCFVYAWCRPLRESDASTATPHDNPIQESSGVRRDFYLALTGKPLNVTLLIPPQINLPMKGLESSWRLGGLSPAARLWRSHDYSATFLQTKGS